MDDFREATCLVTGAGSGIGKAVALRLVERGAHVVANDLSEDRLGELADLGVTAVPGDVSDPDTIEELAATAKSAGVTHLVNAAGIIQLCRIPDVDREMYDRLFSVNAKSVFFLSQAICPLLPRGGSVVNVSSSSAKTGTTLEVAVYAATKAAVLSMTRSFAFQYAESGVRVNAVCPGIIDTPMQERLLEDIAAQQGMSVKQLSDARNRTVPLGRAGLPRECAEVMAFLLSDAASYMTGQAINISGGQITW
jgi:NAD(P)-dependent dehydrogenase (short-subunit alcohol dehydrogenase family)